MVRAVLGDGGHDRRPRHLEIPPDSRDRVTVVADPLARLGAGPLRHRRGGSGRSGFFGDTGGRRDARRRRVQRRPRGHRQNSLQGPLPNGFDVTPTVNYALWASGLQLTYANCTLLVGDS